MANEERDDSVGPRIVRGRVDSVSLYEVTDYELQVLEEGLPGSTYLTFAVFFLSVALSFVVAIGATPPESVRAFTVFVVIIVVGFSAGGVLLVLWYRTRAKLTIVLTRIRDRCLPEPRGDFVPGSGTPESETESGGAV